MLLRTNLGLIFVQTRRPLKPAACAGATARLAPSQESEFFILDRLIKIIAYIRDLLTP